jgi:hypothetical protein
MKEYQSIWTALSNPKILAISLIAISLFSCSDKQPEITKIKCAVENCEEVPRISVHDDIRPKRWRIKSCDRTFVSGKPYNIGDSIEIQIVDYR